MSEHLKTDRDWYSELSGSGRDELIARIARQDAVERALIEAHDRLVNEILLTAKELRAGGSLSPADVANWLMALSEALSPTPATAKTDSAPEDPETPEAA